jgi:shikimate kinase
MTVTEIFAARGEAYFRDLERTAMATALGQPPQLIASGAGWAAEAGNLGLAESRALLLYLTISPLEGARRLALARDRPLLAAANLEARLTELLHLREHWYRLAGIEIPAAQSPEQVAAAVATAARQYAGW